MAVDQGLLGMANLLVDLRQQESQEGETPRTAAPTPKPAASSIAELAQVAKVQGCGYETSDNTLKRAQEQADPTEEKHLKRMRRNRESAALSRNRKKAYIEELEAKVAKLTSTVQELTSENTALKQECTAARREGGPDESAPSSPSTAELNAEDQALDQTLAPVRVMEKHAAATSARC